MNHDTINIVTKHYMINKKQILKCHLFQFVIPTPPQKKAPYFITKKQAKNRPSVITNPFWLMAFKYSCHQSRSMLTYLTMVIKDVLNWSEHWASLFLPSSRSRYRGWSILLISNTVHRPVDDDGLRCAEYTVNGQEITWPRINVHYKQSSIYWFSSQRGLAQPPPLTSATPLIYRCIKPAIIWGNSYWQVWCKN